jgi:hypothetical protein
MPGGARLLAKKDHTNCRGTQTDAHMDRCVHISSWNRLFCEISQMTRLPGSVKVHSLSNSGRTGREQLEAESGKQVKQESKLMYI